MAVFWYTRNVYIEWKKLKDAGKMDWLDDEVYYITVAHFYCNQIENEIEFCFIEKSGLVRERVSMANATGTKLDNQKRVDCNFLGKCVK